MEQISYFVHTDGYKRRYGSAGLPLVGVKQTRGVFRRIYPLALFSILWFMYLSIPTQGMAQDAKKLEGLGRGARDTMRLDMRLKGYQEKDQNHRVSGDYKLKGEEKGLRWEMKEEEGLRLQKQERSNRVRLKKEKQQIEEKRRQREERFWEKKKKVEFRGDLD